MAQNDGERAGGLKRAHTCVMHAAAAAAAAAAAVIAITAAAQQQQQQAAAMQSIAFTAHAPYANAAIDGLKHSHCVIYVCFYVPC